jgi:predicted dehydrogenase
MLPYRELKGMRTGVIRLGIIGCGMAVKRLHWPALSRLGRHIHVVAIARRDYEQAKLFAAEEKIGRVYTDYCDLLGDAQVDAVLTAVPIEMNGSVLLDVLRSGKHVMAEKPIAATMEQARSILREMSGRDQTVLIGENFRYRHDISEAKTILDSGLIGDVFAFQLKVNFDITAKTREPWISRGWRHEARHPGGFILDAGVHPVAALRDLLGEVREVCARVLNTSSVIHGPDSILMQVRMNSGVVGQCFFCYTAKERLETPLDFTIFGTKAVMRVERRGIAITHEMGKPARLKRIEGGGEYLRQWKNFCAAIRGEEAIVSTAERACGDLAVIDAALRSSNTGKPCPVRQELDSNRVIRNSPQRKE